MLHFPRWKILTVLATCLAGLLFSMPNLFSKETVKAWPRWVPHLQMPFGLDLQGGAHLLLAADINELKKDWVKLLSAEARKIVVVDGQLLASVTIAGNSVQQFQPVLLEFIDVGRQQQMRAPLQVEAERHLQVRDPAWPCLHSLLGEEIGHAEQQSGEAGRQYRQDLPAREMQHGCGLSVVKRAVAKRAIPRDRSQGRSRDPIRPDLPLDQVASLTGSPLPRTSATEPRVTRMRICSLSSTSISLSLSFTFVTLPMKPLPSTTVSPRRTFSTISL